MRKRMAVTTSISVVALLAAVVFALLYGSYSMSVSDVLLTLFGKGNSSQNLAILGIRLPRTLVAIFVGVALSASGCTIQGVTRNKLAEPGIIGINSGATLAVVLFISYRSTAYYSALSVSTTLLMPMIAIAGALAAGTLIYVLSRKNGQTGNNRLILVGIGVNIAISAVITLLQLSMSKGNYNEALAWTSGSLWGTGFLYLAMIAPVTIVLFCILIYHGRALDVLSLGDEIAIGLGVSVVKQRKRFLVLAVILAAVATAVAGNIAFVGLIGPHIALKLVGSLHRRKLIIGAFISAFLMVIADTLARNLFSPLEIPVGIILSLIGVPYFIYLMFKER